MMMVTRIVPAHAQVPDNTARIPQSTEDALSSATTPARDEYENILPASSLLTQLRRPTLWCESASTVAVLVWDSALGGAVGWLANYIFSFGNFVSGQPVELQSYATFCAGAMATASIMVAAANMATQAAAMVKLHFIASPARTPTFVGCMWRLLRRTFGSFVVALGLTASSAYGVASLPASTHPYKLHFYVSGLFVYVFVVNLDLVHRRIFQLETVEGQQRRAASTSRKASYTTRLLRLLVQDSLVLFTTYSAAVYIQISSVIRLDTASAVFKFTAMSYALKLLTQELTKTVMMFQEKTNVKTIYIAVTVPTVLIDTQIRTMILRRPNLDQSMAGSVTLAAVEILVRFAKVWFIRYKIWLRERHVVRRIVCRTQSHRSIRNLIKRNTVRWWKRGSVDVGRTRTTVENDPRYLEFLQWCSRYLRFHAAEIQADMVAEYLAIVCSMSIYYFYHAHPKYAWVVHSPRLSDRSNSVSMLSGLKEQAAYLAIQIAMEMVVDFFSCLWELVNGVPMRNAKQARGLISAIFVSTSLANIVLSAAISIHSSSNDR